MSPIDGGDSMSFIHSFLQRSILRQMRNTVQFTLFIWTADNDVQLNTFKTKEMILRTDSTSIPSLSTPAGLIQRVTILSSYLAFVYMVVYPGRPTSIPLYPKQANNVIVLSETTEGSNRPTTATTSFLVLDRIYA